MCFITSGFQTILHLYKPFNPLIGETLQTYFKDGTRYYAEHTSHHPPIANVLIEDPDDLYKFWGYYEF
jgi:hypothetical protein